MKNVKWTLNVDDEEKGYLKETREFILRLKNDLILKILNSSKKNNAIEINPIRSNQKDNL